MKVPALERHCGSWVVIHPDRVFETFSRETAERAAAAGLEVLTALQWLVRMNREGKLAA